MCGLTGYITKRPTKRLLNISRGLMVANQDRGTDSSGIALITDKRIEIIKNTMSSQEFIIHNWGYVEKNPPKILLGHTRQAVIGEINKINAQPFQYGRIVGTHNGVVSNYTDIDISVDVDSEVIFRSLNKEPSYNRAFKKIAGTAAVVWHDNRDPKAIYMVRHDNPLSIAFVEPLAAWIWNSEENPLAAVLNTIFKPEEFKIYSLKENYIYRIDYAGKIVKSKVKFKKNSYAIINGQDYNRYNGYGGVHNGRWWDDNGIDKNSDAGDDLGLSPDLNYNAYEDGCDQCGSQILTGDTFYSDGKFIYCHNCGRYRSGCTKHTLGN